MVKYTASHLYLFNLHDSLYFPKNIMHICRRSSRSYPIVCNNCKQCENPFYATSEDRTTTIRTVYFAVSLRCLQSRANEVHLELEIVFHPLRERSKCTHTHKTHRFATRLRFAEKNRRLGKVRRAVFVFKRTQAERGCGGGGHLVDCGLLLG